jgi:hypothetical protein
VNKKAHRQPEVPTEDDAPPGRPGDDGNPERWLKAAGRGNRQATAEDNGKNFRFDMRFSVN